MSGDVDIARIEYRAVNRVMRWLDSEMSRGE